MNAACLRERQVLERVGFSRATLRRYITAGKFPESVKIGPAMVAWRLSDIDAWIEDPAGWSKAA